MYTTRTLCTYSYSSTRDYYSMLCTGWVAMIQIWIVSCAAPSCCLRETQCTCESRVRYARFIENVSIILCCRRLP